MPSYHSPRRIRVRRRRLRLAIAGAIAAVVGTGIAIYSGQLRSGLSSIIPFVSPTTGTPTASDSLDVSDAVSSATPVELEASDSKSKPKAKVKVPKVELNYSLTGASSSVDSLAISPDGRTLVNSSDYSNVHVWNLGTGCQGKGCNIPTRTLPTYSPWVYTVAISPDSRIVTSGGWQDIKIWNLNKGELLQNIPGHLGAVYDVAIAPNGQMLASGSSDSKIKIWNPSTGKLLHTLTGHADSVRSLTFSPDSKTLVSGSSDNSIKIWNLGSGCSGETCITATYTLSAPSGHAGYVSSVVISPDGKTLVSGSADKTIKFWELKTGKPIGTLAGHSAPVLSIAISPDGKMIASGSADRTIKLWLLKTGQLLTTISGHTSVVNSVTFSPDGKGLISGSSDKTIKVWQLK